MTRNLILLVFSIFVSTSAFAQEYAAVIGVHQTDAETDAANTSVDGVMGFKAGLGVRFQLMENSYFRTGVLYNQRYFETTSAGTSTDWEFAYLDIPATYQYNVNEMFGLFGGLVVAVNIADDYSPTVAGLDPDADKLIPLLTLGVTLMFEDMIGFDFYYERGMGGFAEDLETFSTLGANFNYWF